MSLRTISPVDQKVVVERQATTASEIDTVFTTSAGAFLSYKSTSLDDRISIAYRFLDLLERDTDVLAKELTLQMGRPLRYTPIEIRTAVIRGRYMLKIAKTALFENHINSEDQNIKLSIKKVPLGPIYIIGA